MIVVGIYIKDSVTSEYNRVELFNDEKISVNSSIQNVNDISKTYTDFSQTFTVPASKQNNKIFRHWYENSNDNGFSTLVKADAYIEIDTIPFRSGKIQLESANVKDEQPQDYSITFIGALGSLKDKFNGLYLKDLTDNTYDFEYTASVVKDKVVTTTTSSDVMFPLISSNRYWNYDSATDPANNISDSATPIRFNELFPAIRLKPVLNMIENRFGINFDGTTSNPSTFLSDARFTNAYLYLKNADTMGTKEDLTKVNFTSESGSSSLLTGYTADLVNDRIINTTANASVSGNVFLRKKITFIITPSVSGISYSIKINKNGTLIFDTGSLNSTSGVTHSVEIENTTNRIGTNDYFEIYIGTNQSFTFTTQVESVGTYFGTGGNWFRNFYGASQTTLTSYTLQINQYFPEIKIEDFFSALLKMFNLTCYSTDGINYTVEQLESYYTSGQIRDITKYIKSDNVNLNRVKTYKKINFEYEKSESLVNVGFMSANGIEYGSLFHETFNDGDEYNIKLPFENLNFNNLQDKLQVGYALKTDLQKYTPKPVILYDYNPTALTPLTGTDFWFNTSISGGTSTQHTSYKAFGQEYFDGTDTYSLNFNAQQSTLTNEVITNSLYQQYYENYLANIFDSKARLIKVSGILPTSLLTTLKLNDRLVIRDKRYLINTFTTDLTTGEVQFELLTDFREVPDTGIVLNLDAGNTKSYTGTGTLWADLSEYNNNGTLVNGPTFNSANGGSIVFDGIDDYVVTPTVNLNSFEFTMNMWFKYSSISTTEKRFLLDFRGTTANNSLFIYITPSNKLIIDDRDGALTSDISAIESISTIAPNTWINLSVTVNRSLTGGNEDNIYINGILFASTYLNSNNLNTPYASNPFYIGNNSLFNSPYKGDIASVQVYNRALLEEEILENFNSTKARYGL